jgi:spermidine synthase
VAGALRNGAGHVTAVEIDPGILELGRQLHPESPYTSPRVTIINDDARSFTRKTSKKFDLIVFGLLDSHTLSSSYSNVRLDNYVYTLESFEQAKRLLNPGGMFIVKFEVADDFIGFRLMKMLTRVFEHPPVCLEVRTFRGVDISSGRTRIRFQKG